MSDHVQIALAGAGLVGRWHAEAILSMDGEVALAAIVDPSQDGKAYAGDAGVPWYASLTDLFASAEPDGVILATPNQLHLENALECIAAGCPVLVEKPIATSSTEANQIVTAAREKRVPVLVGHHRRHNPIIQKSKSLIDEGQLGRIITVQSNCWFRKPADYFSHAWRRAGGAGPVMVNAIHDLDLLRYLCGEVASVHAATSSAVRNFETEDTAAVLLIFESGALGTLSVSDTVAAPWSWELTAGENPAYPRTDQSCYLIGGTEASLSLPDARLWRHEGGGNWKDSMGFESQAVENSDPLIAQMKHFVSVIEGKAEPLVSAEEGLNSLALAEAILQSADEGRAVVLESASGFAAPVA